MKQIRIFCFLIIIGSIIWLHSIVGAIVAFIAGLTIVATIAIENWKKWGKQPLSKFWKD